MRTVLAVVVAIAASLLLYWIASTTMGIAVGFCVGMVASTTLSFFAVIATVKT